MTQPDYHDDILNSSAIDPLDKQGRPIPVTIPIALAPGVTVVYTTRLGGVSTGDFAGLNLGGKGGDHPEHVASNRDALARELGAHLSLISQIHSGIAVDIDEHFHVNTSHGFDASGTRHRYDTVPSASVSAGGSGAGSSSTGGSSAMNTVPATKTTDTLQAINTPDGNLPNAGTSPKTGTPFVASTMSGTSTSSESGTLPETGVSPENRGEGEQSAKNESGNNNESGNIASPDVQTPVIEADAQVTTLNDVALGIFAADCLPVMFADAEAGVIGAAHCGRRGLMNGVIAQTVQLMESKGARAERIVATLGPCICGDCYEVGDKIASEFNARFPGTYTRTRFGGPGIDIAAAAMQDLAAAGIPQDNIISSRPRVGAATQYLSEDEELAQLCRQDGEGEPELADRIGGVRHSLCTLENPLWYSHRRAALAGKSHEGRLLALIMRH